MDELFARQIAILRTLIEDYRKREIGLNALIQRIEKAACETPLTCCARG